MNTDLVSVIIPCYNSGIYIKECVDSILQQTYQDFEILITDDGSTDTSTIKLLQQITQCDKRINVFFLDGNSGPAAARNNSIKHAKGRYIAFCDSDDKWLPNKLTDQIPLFDNKHVAIVYSDYEKMDAQGKRNNRIVHAPKSLTYAKYLKGNTIGNLTGIYDAQKVGKVMQKNVHHEDYVLWLDILRHGWTALNTNTVTAVYRIHSNSITANKLKLCTWQWYIYRHHEHLGLISSMYYYLHYAYRAFVKFLI